MARTGSRAAPEKISIELIDQKRNLVRSLLEESRSLRHLLYSDVRLEVVQAKGAVAQNGKPKVSAEEHRLSLGIRVIAGDSVAAPGYYGLRLGSGQGLAKALRAGLEEAHSRALANAREKALAQKAQGPLGQSLYSTRLAPIPIYEKRIPPVMKQDPRVIPLAEMLRATVGISSQIAGLEQRLRFNLVATLTQLRRHLFCSSEGSCIDQTSAMTEGVAVAVAQGDEDTNPVEISDAIGHQCGWEAIEEGVQKDSVQFPNFESFSLALARSALELASAPPLKSTEEEVVVVTDPHFNALLVHEIVGHAVELDRALKMETAYAGRSWLLKNLQENQVGRVIASPQVSAFSDPTLNGYGHYLYDDEGTPAQRVFHIEKGVFREFLNSRQTAALLGAMPNGSYKATEAAYVPLIRMSNTAFAPGDRDPQQIIREVEHGFYVKGYRIPSVAESRENFYLSAVKVYEIRQGELGRLYRDGAVMADSRDYFRHVDAVGNDFRLFPILNCGKGQPMQAKRVGNGGPTLRSVARLVGR